MNKKITISRIFHQPYLHCTLAWHLSWCLRIIVAFLHFIVASSEDRGRGRAWPATAAASPPEFASRGQVCVRGRRTKLSCKVRGFYGPGAYLLYSRSGEYIRKPFSLEK